MEIIRLKKTTLQILTQIKSSKFSMQVIVHVFQAYRDSYYTQFEFTKHVQPKYNASFRDSH